MTKTVEGYSVNLFNAVTETPHVITLNYTNTHGLTAEPVEIGVMIHALVDGGNSGDGNEGGGGSGSGSGSGNDSGSGDGTGGNIGSSNTASVAYTLLSDDGSPLGSVRVVNVPGTNDYTVLDENDTPLGTITVPDGGSIEQVLLESGLVPTGVSGIQKINPRTGDLASPLNIAVLILFGMSLAIVLVRKLGLKKA